MSEFTGRLLFELGGTLPAWWEAAGLEEPETYPISTEKVLELLKALDFTVTLDDLAGWIDNGILEVATRRGRRDWCHTAILSAIGQCEARRRWQFCPRHSFKMNAAELAKWEAAQSGSGPFADLDQFDLESLLHHMARAESRAVRDCLLVAIGEKLKGAKS